MADETLTCRDCNGEFVLEDGEKQWLRDKFGDDYRKPTRCLPCRKKRKASRNTPSVRGPRYDQMIVDEPQRQFQQQPAPPRDDQRGRRKRKKGSRRRRQRDDYSDF